MNFVWRALGIGLNWLGTPLLKLYLEHGVRSRVIIASGDKVLLVQGWLSNGKWMLPGGGLHKNEPPEVGAIREIKEEVGFDVRASNLNELSRGRIKDNVYRINYVLYELILPVTIKPQKQFFELSDCQWFDVDKILSMPKVSNATHYFIKEWRKRGTI
jgi:8-oxo-dGTP pyrophosphatase MutT (NUDIX family)